MFVVAPSRNATSVIRTTSLAWSAAARACVKARSVEATASRAVRTSEVACRSALARCNLTVSSSATRSRFSPARKPASNSGTENSTVARHEREFANSPAGASTCGEKAAVTDGR